MITDFGEITQGHKPNSWPRQELKLDILRSPWEENKEKKIYSNIVFLAL